MLHQTTKLAAAVLAALTFLAAPLQAEVIAQSDAGFVVKLTTETTAPPTAAWRMWVTPATGWSSDRTWSHNAANLYFDAQVSGCFCEKLPKPLEALGGQRIGSVEHMHVINVDPQRGILRMSGALGPLQGEALNGTLTITLVRTESGTRINLKYFVGGLIASKPQR